MKNKSIVFGTGCFWCSEASFQLVAGVTSVVPGYAGGTADDANYDAVCTGTTDHVEVSQVMYDPNIVTLETLLAMFWSIHDPTSLNRQGADAGPQYASVIYYDDEADVVVINASRDDAQSQLDNPIVTRIEPLDVFYEAEDYHHNYFVNNPSAGYCRVVIEPKLTKLRTHFAQQLA